MIVKTSQGGVLRRSSFEKPQKPSQAGAWEGVVSFFHTVFGVWEGVFSKNVIPS